jgi:hypothetical protein
MPLEYLEIFAGTLCMKAQTMKEAVPKAQMEMMMPESYHSLVCCNVFFSVLVSSVGGNH